jgi:hypothetical protein
MWNEVVMACSEILSRYLPGEAMKMMTDISHNIQSPGGDSNPVYSTYEPRVMPTQP